MNQNPGRCSRQPRKEHVQFVLFICDAARLFNFIIELLLLRLRKANQLKRAETPLLLLEYVIYFKFFWKAGSSLCKKKKKYTSASLKNETEMSTGSEKVKGRVNMSGENTSTIRAVKSRLKMMKMGSNLYNSVTQLD